MASHDYRLWSCIWELTLKCNLNCIHCGSVAGVQRKNELTPEECFRVADELYDLGCKEISFIGGEVFFFKGWEKIARYLSDKGILVNIMTNGYRLGEKEIEQIKRAGLANVGVSVDGMEENHNRIRGKRDAFAQILEVFDLLNKEQIPIGVVTCLMDFNYPDLNDMYDLLVSNGITLWQMQLANPMGNLAGKRELILNSQKIPAITSFIRRKNMERKMVIIAADSIGYYDDNEMYIRGRRAPVCYWDGCQAGISSICIDSIGNIKGCGALYSEKFIEGNIREKSLSEIWNDRNNFSYNRNFKPQLLNGKCRKCDLGKTCKGGCRASNFFTCDSLYESAFCSILQN